jgi:predicted porin
MKKTLYSTTFLATAGVLALGAGDAFAQAAAPAAEKLKRSLGGYLWQLFGYADQRKAWEDANDPNSGYKKFDVNNDSEVYFTGSLQLDNGLTVAVVTQLETQRSTTTGNDWIDESYMRVFSPTLGELKLGSMDPLTNALSVTAPFVGIRYNNADQNVWIIPGTSAAGNSTAIGGGDDNRIGYYTPTIAGFRAGTSYTPSTTNADTQPSADETQTFDIGAQYGGKVGDVGFRASVNYWNSKGASESASHDNWTFGADVTFANITLGGSYLMREGDKAEAAGGTSVDLDTWDIGIVYRPGPWSAGVTYVSSKADDTFNDTDSDKVRRLTVGATYALGPGVELVGNFLYHKYDTENDSTANDNKGWALVGGIKFDF